MTSSAHRPRRLAAAVLSSVVGVGLLGLAWTRVPALPQALTITWPSIGIYAGLVAAYHVIRTWRWHGLVSAVAPVSPRITFPVAWAGFLWIVLLPLRLGELVRPILLSRRSDVAFTQALSSIALERVVDAGLIASLCLAAPLVLGPSAESDATTQTIAEVARLLAYALLAAAAGLLLAAWRPAITARVIVGPLSSRLPRVGRRVHDTVEHLAQGLAALRQVRTLLHFVITTGAYWILTAVAMAQLATAAGLAVSFTHAAVLMGILGLSLLLPSAPAQAGPFQLGLVVGLELIGLTGASPDAVASYVVVCHGTQVAVTALFGAWAHVVLAHGWPTRTRYAELPQANGHAES